MPKVRHMKSRMGGNVANQFVIEVVENGVDVEYLQSYHSIIVRKEYGSRPSVTLDVNKWDYSSTTRRYRNKFLGETSRDVRMKINSGEYQLANLNL